MSTSSVTDHPSFGTRLIGETEKALSGFLTRALAETGLSERDWIVLRGSATPGLARDRNVLAAQLAGVFKVSVDETADWIASLASRGLLTVSDGAVALTETGTAIHDRVFAETVAISDSLWSGIPAADLDVAARVLATVLARANERLAA